jgi:hypothetical protein
MPKAPLNLCVAAILSWSSHSLAADAPTPDYGPSWQQTGRLEAFTAYDDPSGKVGVLLAHGPVTIKNHPFFRPTGPSGRSCATCHAPENAMGLSTDSLQARWKQSGEADAVFASIDGANFQIHLKARRHRTLYC